MRVPTVVLPARARADGHALSAGAAATDPSTVTTIGLAAVGDGGPATRAAVGALRAVGAPTVPFSFSSPRAYGGAASPAGERWCGARTGAHEVHGLIRERWRPAGGETGFLRYPTSDERVGADGAGRLSEFEGRHRAWSPSTGARTV